MVMVAVTGAGSTLGLLVLARLRERGHLAHALDVRRPDTEAPFRATSPDGTLRPGSLEHIQMAVHLLQPHEPTRDPSRGAAADVESTRSLLREVEAAGCDTVILVSSATVYGAHEDNPVPLREDAPLRADPAFPFAWHKRLADELVREWAQAHPHVRVVVLRPVTVLGDGHEDFVARHLESPRLPLVRGHMPPMQALHAEDLAAAVTVAIESDLRGPCNVAPDGWLTAEEVCQILRRKPLRLPETLAFPLARRAWGSHLAAAPAGGLHYLMHPWVVDTRTLRDAGWRPRFTNREVLEGFAAAHHGHLAVGALRTSRRALAAAGLGAATATGLLLRRLRRA